MLPAEPMEQHLSRQSLTRLRREITGAETLRENARVLALDVSPLDRALSGGLPCAALHEIGSVVPLHLGAAAGFTLALATRAQERGKETLWITTDVSLLQTGTLYGPGLDQFGLSVDRLLNVRVPRPVDALFAMEEALKCHALSAVVAEFAETPNLTATRRLSLAAREGSALGLMLRHNADAAPSATMTRWEVASAPSQPDEFGGLGRTAFSVTLARNRRGPCGAFTLTWDHHERVFAALSLGVDEAASDRPNCEALRTG